MLELYSAPLRRLSAAYMPELSDRQDLFQEIALALWTSFPSFRAEASERTWVYRVAHNVALTCSAKRRRQQRTEEVMEPAIHDPAPPQDVRRLALLNSVQQLEPVDRQLIVLHLEGLTAREIEEVTGMTANNIGVRLTRIRRKLASALTTSEGSAK